MSPAAKRKPLPGHKFMGLKHAFETRCECGWNSCTYYGRGAAGQARGEWESHRAKHERGEIAPVDMNGKPLAVMDRVRVHTGEEGVISQFHFGQTKSVNVLSLRTRCANPARTPDQHSNDRR
jgi:hypothetical protein